MNVHTAVVEAGEKISGPTVHFVNDKYDEGNIISQTIVELDKNETPETLSASKRNVGGIKSLSDCVLYNTPLPILNKSKNFF